MPSLRALFLAGLSLSGAAAADKAKRPNVIFIMSDDQDRLMDSCDYMPALQREIVEKGTTFTNHFGTVSNCCPSRASLLRGQHAHNTNITHVRAPGGNYDKWLMSRQDHNYLPHWITKAGYRAEYVGKFLNGLNTVNYVTAPRGWDHVDTLIEPYIGDYNNPVWTQNGERPVVYRGYHQTDTVRIKALDRLDYLLSDEQEKPFYLTITPYAPHVSGDNPPVPQSRYEKAYSNVTVPKFANWNPADEIQQQKSVFLKNLPLLNSTQIEYADWQYRQRLRALLGVDEIIEDVVAMLEKKGQLDNTYIIYTTDNGYHIGAHRLPSGKALPYVMDTNLPLMVRGPNVPAGLTSNLASSHIDFAPTFLDIMGLPSEEWPPFLDGRSLVEDWHDSSPSLPKTLGEDKEIMNIEFWGNKITEAPYDIDIFNNNTYKTLRIASSESALMFAKWCTNEMELYNTTADPWEIHNLAHDSNRTPEIERLMDRLNAILMVTKSCESDSCRDPWSSLQPPQALKPVKSLSAAMDPLYDSFFAEEVPKIHFDSCLLQQSIPNEQPYYPAGVLGADGTKGLGREWRDPTDNFITTEPNGTQVPSNAFPAGSWKQRDTTISELEAAARGLTDDELGTTPGMEAAAPYDGPALRD